MAGEHPTGCFDETVKRVSEIIDKYPVAKTIHLSSPRTGESFFRHVSFSGETVKMDRKQPEINSDCPNWRRFILDENESESAHGIEAIERVLSAESVEPIEHA